MREQGEAIALVYGEEELSYGELNSRANQLAHYLIEQGVKPDTLVGISQSRSIWMMVCLLGIQKSGGAYVPLDPSYPEERLSYMLEDSGVTVILGTESERGSLPLTGQRYVEVEREDWSGYSEANPEVGVKPEHLVYVIYTSGSTGKPKGVLVEHGTVTNFLYYLSLIHI